ncbi:homing endonuclease associated repeat-containing protein [Halorubrum trapanicum]|uniref:homing endonuclease associated repeat-containing protein n=1 Tax=Halorubrum trapanicum TaxID=29284 RepID=UPI000BBA6FF7|nr:hypothetical protein [Halorubrum trapanicum]
MPQYSDADFLEEIRRVADLSHVDGPPSERTFGDEADMSAQIVRRRFGSWRTAIEQAGFDFHTQADKIPRDKLVAELRWLRDEVGRIPTAEQMDEHGGYAYITYYERFGSWREALDAAGFDPDRGPTDAELLAELHRLRDELEKRPSMNDMTDHGAYGCSTYQRRFGSWSAALEEAFDTESADESRGSE